VSAATALKWDYFEDDDDEFEEEPDLDYLEEEEYDDQDELDQADFHPQSSIYRPETYPPYAQSFALPAPATYSWNNYGSRDAEAVYAYAYAETIARRRPRSVTLSDLLAGLFRNRLIVIILALVIGWLIISTGLNWLNSLNRSEVELYSFSGTGGVVISAADGPPVAAAPVAVPPGAMSVEGKPSLTVAKIEQVLRQYNSPAAGTGQYLYDTGLKYNIDPAFALAFFVHESTAGTKGVAVTTKSIGNIRQTANSGFDGYQGFRKYPTWEAGIEDWYKLIRNQYINGWGLRTVESIIPKYAPAADHNNPDSYINQVRTMVAGWRSGK
jgi:hypothetical protein